MTTQVIFRINKKLKDQAMRKAQAAGVPFASFLKMATQAYVEGAMDLQLVAQPRLNKKTRMILVQELDDIKKGKNISPAFDNADEAIRYLKKL